LRYLNLSAWCQRYQHVVGKPFGDSRHRCTLHFVHLICDLRRYLFCFSELFTPHRAQCWDLAVRTGVWWGTTSRSTVPANFIKKFLRRRFFWLLK